MIPRPETVRAVKNALRRNPVTVLLGPRQCGKTTLARMLLRDRRPIRYFDLEDPAAVESLRSPATVLGAASGLVIIDEVQRRPDLFPVLRVLADRKPASTRFLILGSASPDLIRQSSETLAGRVEFVEMGPFGLTEVGKTHWLTLWWRGGFPRAFLAGSNGDSLAWREQFVRTFLERDLAQLGLNLPALTMRRFWTMVAHYHGQTWNSSEIGASLGVSDHTSRRYLDVLAGAYMVRALPPWHENVGKRQRRAPKVYLRDSGLLHALLGIDAPEDLWAHPKCGASWEGFALENVLRLTSVREAYYWAVHGGPELDLLLMLRGRRIGVEFKFADAPRMDRLLDAALDTLRLDRLWVVYPGKRRYELSARAEALPLSDIAAVFARPQR